MATYAGYGSAALGVNPTSVSGGVELSHIFRFTIQVEGDPIPISLEAPVSVVPVTRPMLDLLLSQSDSFLSSSDPSVASFARFLNEFKGGRTLDAPEAQLSEEEALAQAIALSMQDDMANAMADSLPPGMSEEEALRLAIEASMGEQAAGGSSRANVEDPHAKFNMRTASILIQRLGAISARKAFLLQNQGKGGGATSKPTLHKVITDFTEVNLDEISLRTGDIVVVVKVFDDQWAEGYSVKSFAAGRFPLAVLGDKFEVPDAGRTGISAPWISLDTVRREERRIDDALVSKMITPQDYVSQRRDVLSTISP
ncbi:hypothetical protein HDU96_000625 [Phlyctochytrium bullatum]|nr:hypothetical protein HDU96_000625 [Phlyctochytrium bullatum]